MPNWEKSSWQTQDSITGEISSLALKCIEVHPAVLGGVTEAREFWRSLLRKLLVQSRAREVAEDG